MAELEHALPSTSSSLINRESSGADASSSNSSTVRVEVEHVRHERNFDNEFRHPEFDQQNVGFSYRGNFSRFDDAATVVGNDTWTCIILIITFWFFVSMTLILGVYGAVNTRLGPYTSLLIQPNPLFVRAVKVEELDEIKAGLKLYGFYKTPPLDVVINWSESLSASLPADSHKDWVYLINERSQINISYSVKSPSSSIFLILAQGDEGLAQWLEDATYPNSTLSWNIIHGSGMIHQVIYSSSKYYVALGNLNSEDVEVTLNLTVQAFLYNTSEAYYKCTFTHGLCSTSVMFPGRNAVVLTSPGMERGKAADDWYVRVSYEPRWFTYVAGIAGMTLLMLVVFNYLSKFQSTREGRTGAQYGTADSATAPLLSHKDDDLSSWGSSYDSVSNDDEDLEDLYPEGKAVREGETGNNTRRLCAICFDAPRDCFFLPCGHCVACFACGTRIAEAAGTCPICRRNIKKVRKIYTV